MQFKTDREQDELVKAPIALRIMAAYFEHLSLQFGVDPVVTRILRKVDGESGVHQDYRAIDFRDEVGVGGVRLYTQAQAEVIVKKMNERFPRNDARLSCIHHAFVNHSLENSSRAPYHYHVQLPWEWKSNPKTMPLV